MRGVDVPAAGGTLRAYDTGADDPAAGRDVLFWHPGSPHTGVPLPPLVAAAAARGFRLVTYARPGYGASTARPGRTMAAGADEAARVADALGVDRFAAMGYSGGGPNALACAALLPDRVTAVVTLACLAPFAGDDGWFATMASDGAVRAAVAGRETRRRYADTHAFDPETFTPADWAALAGGWRQLGEDASAAHRAGPDGLVDDDVALLAPWGFEVGAITAPVLLAHGDEDRVAPYAHSEWLHRDIPGATLWRREGAGHVSVLDACPAALDWLRAAVSRG